MRLWALDLKPVHFDEGINGWFVDQMRGCGFYRYDPENYHGPLYFYGLFVFLSLLGKNIWALRLPSTIASILSVWVMLRFDRFFGAYATRLGALALAVSPAAVFFGRYAIHESWLVLSLMITTWGLLGLWKSGSRRDLIITITGVTLLFLIKETAVIHLGCFLMAAGCLVFWQKIVPSQPSTPLAKRGWSESDFTWCYGLSLLALIFFYSGTFLNWSGLPNFFLAYGKWFHTGIGEGGHVKGDYQLAPLINYYWLALMKGYEWPCLLGLLYTVRLTWPAPAMLRYLAIYAVGVLIAYSIVPYKTPWCIISILWPFFLLFGSAVEEVWQNIPLKISSSFLRRALLFLTFLTATTLLASSLFISLRLNFQRFADPKEPYVYVQTMPEIVVLTKPVLAMALRDPRNHAMSGEIVLESYYPLPWIFSDFTRIGYYGKDDLPAEFNGDFIVALTSQQKVIEGALKQPYLRQRFHLRDSMDECTVWFRESVFAPWFAEVGHGMVDRIVPPTLKSPSPLPEPKPKP